MAVTTRIKKLEADVVIAGGGPGGCTVARELSMKGKRVVLLEQGGDSKFLLGTPFGILLRLEKGAHFPFPVKRTLEADNMILARCVGGGTVIYAGSAFEPNLEYWKRHGIDISRDLVDEARVETWANLAPDEFIGPGTRRVWEAADGLNYPIERLHRHVDFSKCKVGCEDCTLGCPKGAKWTGAVFMEQAIKNGATLLTHARVTDVIIKDGVATGVRAVGGGGKKYEVRAKAVVLSAGGTHTARILQRSGFSEAGSWFTGDPTIFCFGFVKDGPSNTGEHNMTVGWHDEEHGIVFCAMASPFLAWHMQFFQDEPRKALTRLHRFGKLLSMFSKVSDDGTGRVYPDAKVSKTFTERDMKRLEYGRETMTKILVKAGCDPDDVHRSGFILGHPSGTVKVGKLLDTNLETSTKNLYCCDTSVFPEAPGRPPAMTVVVLGKRLARHLEKII